MLTKCPVTVYNRYENKDDKKTYWRGTNIGFAKWEQTTKVSVTGSGLNTADMVKVMIWFDSFSQDKVYIPPKEYAKLRLDELDGYWTLKEDDKIFKGNLPDDIQDITDLIKANDSNMTIKSIKTVDYGGSHMFKWEVVGA